VVIACGAHFDRSIFIPGESRENELLREVFIKSNSLKLLLFLKKRYPNLCSSELSTFTENLSEKDWELFYECSGNKQKRCYSPKVNTAPDSQSTEIVIDCSALEDKPRVSAK
jgi:succinate dehydrogenase flavin-adding protein (antitoxin of CptAB toxin-antitoxin module)